MIPLLKATTGVAVILAGVTGSAAATGPTDSGATSQPRARAVHKMSLPPQAADTTNPDTHGPSFGADDLEGMRISFVVPPERGTKPLRMRVYFFESSAGACSWYAYTAGLAGPTAPGTGENLDNFDWRPPGTTQSHGPISVPAGESSLHTAVFRWDGPPAKPGMLIQFALSRSGNQAADTCAHVTISGLEVLY